MLFSTPNGLFAFDRESDSLQLVKLYNSTDGPSWSVTWNLEDPMSTWKGVSLDTSGQVVALALLGNNLVGTLPNLVLPNIKQLVLKRNTLRAELPPFSGMKNLVFVDISENQLDGELVDFDLSQLQTIDLSNNLISGNIPNFSKMPSVKRIVLNRNRLEGAIPDFSMIPNLLTLRCAENLLEGTIPEFNFLEQLIELDLHGNRFIGSPPEFRGSIQLFVLDLSDNQLTGFVPGFSRLLQMDKLNLSNNRLTGTISNLAALTIMTQLDLSNNFLEGNLPDLRVNKKLTDIDLSGNSFTGTIPSYAGLDQLQRLFVSNNELGDTLPDLSYLPELTELRIDSNDFTYSNFDVTSSSSLRVLEADYNRFTFSDLKDINGLGLTRFVYGPQKPIQMVDTIFTTIGEDIVIDLVEDFDVMENTYSWYLNDQFLIATSVNELVISSINGLDQGIYYAQVRNDDFPGLPQLFSEDIVLVMDCPYNEISVVDSICIGDTIFVNGKAYFETGEYTDTVLVPEPTACDTIFSVSLMVFPTYDTTLLDTICESDQVMFGGGIIEDSGFYTDTLTTINGCDSIVHLDLVVRPAFTKVDEAEMCKGDTLFVGDLFHTTTGIYFDTLQTIYGCDSVVISDLTVIDSFLDVTTVNLCIGEGYAWRGDSFTVSGIYVDRFTNSVGCDSTYVLDLFIPESSNHARMMTICSGDSVVVDTNVYRTSGFYVDTLITSRGCDSIVSLTLTVVDKFEEEYDFDICDGDTLFFGEDTITRPGIYLDSLVAVGGCDSIIKVRVNVVSFVSLTIDTTVCFGDTVYVGNSAYGEEGVFRDTLNTSGCDTVVSTTISIVPEIKLEGVRSLINAENVGSINPTISGGGDNLTFRWNTGDTTRILDSIPAGDYRLTVSSGLCQKSFVFDLDPTTSLQNQLPEAFGIDLFPNPSFVSQEITMDLSGADQGQYQVIVFDVHGRQIMEQRVSVMGSNRQVIGIQAPANAGLYTLKITDAKGRYAAKLLMVQ